MNWRYFKGDLTSGKLKNAYALHKESNIQQRRAFNEVLVSEGLNVYYGIGWKTDHKNTTVTGFYTTPLAGKAKSEINKGCRVVKQTDKFVMLTADKDTSRYNAMQRAIAKAEQVLRVFPPFGINMLRALDMQYEVLDVVEEKLYWPRVHMAKYDSNVVIFALPKPDGELDVDVSDLTEIDDKEYKELLHGNVA